MRSCVCSDSPRLLHFPFFAVHLLSYHPVFPPGHQHHLPRCGGQIPCALSLMRTLAPLPSTTLSHCENLRNGQNGLDPDGMVLTQRRSMRDAKTNGIQRIQKHSRCEGIIQQMIQANCCTELKRRGNVVSWRQLVCCAVTLWRVVQNSRGGSLQFSTDVCSNARAMLVAMTPWSPEAWVTLPSHYNDGSEYSHVTAITSPVHCYL